MTIDKTVREDTGGTVPADCEGTYVQGTAAPLPLYAPGDKICWQLRVNFAANLFAGTPAVTDFLPPNEKYLAGTAHEVDPTNNVESTFDESEAEGGALEWELGESVASGAKVWEWRFATEMGTSIESKPEDITGNLMKFVYSNTLGQTFPLRDRAEIEREEPDLQLKKGVYSVGGVPARRQRARSERDRRPRRRKSQIPARPEKRRQPGRRKHRTMGPPAGRDRMLRRGREIDLRRLANARRATSSSGKAWKSRRKPKSRRSPTK